MEICRGDIYYVRNYVRVSGSEQTAERPAVIVSNDTGNYYSDMCEVVYLTTKEKKPLPTHTDVMCKVQSISLCEQICSVSQDRIGEYIRSCTDGEMKDIDRALMISLGIEYDKGSEETDAMKAQLEDLRKLADEQKTKLYSVRKELEVKNAELEDIKEKGQDLVDAGTEYVEEMHKTRAERDVYKQLYQETLEKLFAKAE